MLIDTSTIIEILLHPKTSERFTIIQDHVRTQELYVLVVQFAEISDWCIENRISPRERIEAVKRFASIIPLDEEICLDGSRIKSDRRRDGFKNFSLLDGLVLAAARSVGEKLLTFDKDFSGEKDCLVLK